jgi:hypothetical protein
LKWGLDRTMHDDYVPLAGRIAHVGEVCNVLGFYGRRVAYISEMQTLTNEIVNSVLEEKAKWVLVFVTQFYEQIWISTLGKIYALKDEIHIEYNY